MGFIPRYLVTGGWFSQKTVEWLGCAPTGQCDNETAVTRHRCLSQLHKQLGCGLIQLVGICENFYLGNENLMGCEWTSDFSKKSDVWRD